MTLILLLANERYAVQVSDRRLTNASGPVDEEAAKAAIFRTQDGRFTVGYTGLARDGRGYETQFAILDHLSQIGKSGIYNAGAAISALAPRLTRDFRNLRADREAKRTSVLITGFRVTRGHDKPLLSVALISNFESFHDPNPSPFAKREFHIDKRTALPQDAHSVRLGVAIGTTAGLDEPEMAEIRRLVDSTSSAEAVTNRSIRAVLAAAESPRSDGAIGRQLMITTVTAGGEPTGRYATSVPSQTLYWPDQVTIGRGNFGGRLQLHMQAVDEGVSPLVVPRVARNRPCPCGSGKRYKQCHGTHAQA